LVTTGPHDRVHRCSLTLLAFRRLTGTPTWARKRTSSRVRDGPGEDITGPPCCVSRGPTCGLERQGRPRRTARSTRTADVRRSTSALPAVAPPGRTSGKGGGWQSRRPRQAQPTATGTNPRQKAEVGTELRGWLACPLYPEWTASPSPKDRLSRLLLLGHLSRCLIGLLDRGTWNRPRGPPPTRAHRLGLDPHPATIAVLARLAVRLQQTLS
jgi:hypothetical protein